ncbi:MAG: ubiquinol-cytochrome c reductase iron-sulfur subunit [Cyanobacteria bacterium J06626_18]
MRRRDFVNWVGLGVLASSLPVAIAACQPDTASAPDAAPAEGESTAAAPSRDDGFVQVGSVSALDESGSIAEQNVAEQQVVVIRDPSDTAAVLAVNALCTHQGCSVDWNPDAGVFVCPCHDSQFNPDGSVAQGPATAPLPTYDAKIEGDIVLVSVS